VSRAAQEEEQWLEQFRAGLLALLTFLDGEPEWTRRVVLEVPFEGAFAVESTRLVSAALSEVLREGRRELIVGAQLNPPPELIAELVITAVYSAIRTRVLKGESGPLMELAPSLMEVVIVPYLGRGAAKADLARSPVVVADAPARAEVVPIRPSPQTVLALSATVAMPRANNPEIAGAVAITSKQASKTLKLLERRGLIEDTRQAPGEPHAWVITPYGRRVLVVITDSFAAASLREQREAQPRRASLRPGRKSGVEVGRAARRAA